MNGLEQLAPDLWVARRPLRLAVGDIGARMTVIRLANDGLLLHSPVALDAPLQTAVDTLGRVSWIVGPNKAHHMFLGAYADVYPQARLCGAPGLAAKRRDLTFQYVLGAELPPEWPAEITTQVIDGAPWMNEVALLHRPSKTLVVTDLVFNLPPGARNEARLFHRLVGATGRFGPHRLIRFGIRDRVAARRSIERILAWDFDRVVMAHGEVVPSGGRAMIEQAFMFLRNNR